MISEQEISDTSNIELSVPASGAIAPTGEYYVTAFLMTKSKRILTVTVRKKTRLLLLIIKRLIQKLHIPM